jgi:hypothetical protein
LPVALLCITADELLSDPDNLPSLFMSEAWEMIEKPTNLPLCFKRSQPASFNNVQSRPRGVYMSVLAKVCLMILGGHLPRFGNKLLPERGNDIESIAAAGLVVPKTIALAGESVRKTKASSFTLKQAHVVQYCANLAGAYLVPLAEFGDGDPIPNGWG